MILWSYKAATLGTAANYAFPWMRLLVATAFRWRLNPQKSDHFLQPNQSGGKVVKLPSFIPIRARELKISAAAVVNAGKQLRHFIKAYVINKHKPILRKYDN